MEVHGRTQIARLRSPNGRVASLLEQFESQCADACQLLHARNTSQPHAASGREPLTIAVSPAVALAPDTVRIRARIEPSPDNRRLTIVADGAAFYRSSEMQLEGEQAPKTIEVWLREVPGGDYEV